MPKQSRDELEEPFGVTLKRAGELLGGDLPLSVRTISAMITRGDLEAYGVRKTRRVTMRSIRAYWENRPWRNMYDASNEEPDIPLGRRVGHGSRSTRNSQADESPGRISIPARLPKIGVIKPHGPRRKK